MFSKILIKLIDQAILPAILLLVVRVVSVLLLAQYFGYLISIGQSGFVFESKEAYFVVNTYSIFSMVAVLIIGILYILLKSLVFHESHVTPKMATRLFSYRLSSFIQNSFDVYSQATVWMSYVYLMLVVSGMMAFFSLIEAWVFYVTLVLSILTTVLFIVDIEREIHIHNKDVGDHVDELDTFEEEAVVAFERLAQKIKSRS